jgi:hypothetical protein
MITICINAPSSFIALVFSYGIAFYLLRRKHPKLKWAAIAIMGITAMQLIEGLLWLDGPNPNSTFNKILTVGFIPLVLLTQAWGPLFGSLFVVPFKKRRAMFFLLLIYAVVHVVVNRIINNPIYTQVTPQGFLNWYSAVNPPQISPWIYMLWGLTIGAPFLLWYRPLRQALMIVGWGLFLGVIAFVLTDSPASFWCFFVFSYALFVLVWSRSLKDRPETHKTEPKELKAKQKRKRVKQ